jgi:hypothetical protein
VVIIFYFIDAGAFGRKEEKGEEKRDHVKESGR